MKKLFLLGLMLTHQAFAAQITPQDIVGEWSCKIQYPEMKIHTIDLIEYQADGTSVGTGYLFLTDLLAYETQHTGKWTLNNNILSEISNDYSTIPIHSDKTMKRIATDPEFKQWEANFYTDLKKGNNSGESVNLQIHQLVGDTMSIEHIMDENRKFAGICQKRAIANE